MFASRSVFSGDLLRPRSAENLAGTLVGVRGFEPPAPASRRQCSITGRPSHTPPTGFQHIAKLPLRALRLGRAIPSSDPAKQRHNIIGNRLAWVGEESVSGVTADPPPVNQEYPLMRVYIIGNDGITLCRRAPAILN